MSYPVHFAAQPAERFTRLQLGLRILALIAIGVTGASTGGLYCILYLGLPVLAAVRIATLGSAAAYASGDGPLILAGLRWAAAVTSWLGLAVENLPQKSPDEVMRLEISGTPAASPGTAALRILLGLPSAFVLGVLSFVGFFVFCWAAVTIVFGQRVAPSAWAYLVGLQRWSYRLLAYQAALVDEYPPFALSEDPLAGL